MKIIKLAFILIVSISLYSFAYHNSVEDGREQLFKIFLNQFKSIQLPSKIAFKLSDKTDKRVALDEKFDAFIPGITNGRMSRLGPSTYEAELLLSADNNFATIIYSRSRGFDGKNKSYYLATFDQHGAEIGTQFLGYTNDISYIDMDMAADLKISATIMHSDDDYDAAVKNFFPKSVKKMFISAKGEILSDEDKVIEKKETTPIQQQVQKLG